MTVAPFFHAYLVSYLYWLAFPLGSTALIMIYRLTGGAWGDCTLRHLQASAATLAPFALLFLPVLLAQAEIYPWTHSAVRATLKGGNRLYLTQGFFAVRSILYFLGWILLALGTLRAVPGKASEKVRKIAAGGLVFYGLSTSFASFDWQMSLDPGWRSTVYGLIFGISMILECWAGILLAVSVGPQFSKQTDKTQRDLTNLLLAFIMVWAYLSFVQYLIIWCGNIPDELIWLYVRTRHGWQALALMLVILQFALPFSLLFFRRIKTRARNVTVIASIVLVARIVEQYWYVEPSLHTSGFLFNPWIIPTFLVIGVIWLTLFRMKYLAEAIENA